MTTSRVLRRGVAPTAALALLIGGGVPSEAGEDEDTGEANGIVVRINPGAQVTSDILTAVFPIEVDSTLLASRGMYLFAPTNPAIAQDSDELEDLAKDIEDYSGIEYAEVNIETTLADQRGYRVWADTIPNGSGTNQDWHEQGLVQQLQLQQAHEMGSGAGQVIAVLDTGVDTDHPALQQHLVAGYDYIDDDHDPREERVDLDSSGNGAADQAFGHGTFVAGTAVLVAPEASVMPMRVLDSDGVGNTFVVAAAITEAVDSGADVLNLSIGAPANMKSDVVEDALKHAKNHDVLIVAAAGNTATEESYYPASNKEVLSVTSVGEDSVTMSPFSNYGDKVDVAAQGGRVLGPLPGGDYAWWSGTSMAAPQVSGQIALIRSATNDDDRKHHREAVTKTAHKIDGDDGRKIKHGSIDLMDSLINISDR